jgi:hypothetical protein
MKHHSELINLLIKTNGLRTYLEIGTFNRAHNFNKIKCPIKMCVDPDPKANADFKVTSDDFFEQFEQHGILDKASHTHVFDFGLVFIDGLHHADQVEKDFYNALKNITNRGFIVMHDCNPHSEHITHVPRDNGEWCGDVYKFAARLGEINGIDFMTVDADYGCSVIWKAWWKKSTPVGEITWDRFDKERKQLLRLRSFESLLDTIKRSKASEKLEQLP